MKHLGFAHDGGIEHTTAAAALVRVGREERESARVAVEQRIGVIGVGAQIVEVAARGVGVLRGGRLVVFGRGLEEVAHDGDVIIAGGGLRWLDAAQEGRAAAVVECAVGDAAGGVLAEAIGSGAVVATAVCGVVLGLESLALPVEVSPLYLLLEAKALPL